MSMQKKTSSGSQGSRDNPVVLAFRPVYAAFWGVAVVSFVINILMLTGPVFMLQV